MQKIVLTLLVIGQILMATTIEHIDVKGVEVPFIFEEDKRLPLVNVQIVFTNSGSITDTKKAGLAKFCAKMLNEGTLKDGSSAFADKLESKAIHISASAGEETFVLQMSSLKEQVDFGLDYLDELLKDPNYSDEAFSKVKTMTLGSLSAKESDFDYVAANGLKALLFHGTVLANPKSGTPQSVESITLSDVKDFIKEHIVRSRVIVLAGGDFDVKEMKEKIVAILKNMSVGKASKVKHYNVTQINKEEIIKKDTKQAYIYFGSPYNISVDDKEYYMARVATFILGTGGFGSRLMEEIRVKKGLAYSAYARVEVKNSCSYMSGYLQTKLESMDEAKKSVKEVIATFVKKGVTQDELEQTKKFLLGSEPLRVETMSQRLNRTFMDYYKGFEFGHSSKELQLIKNLKLDALNNFIKKHQEILNLNFAIVTK